MLGENGVTRSVIDELRSSDIQGDQMEGESMVLLEVSLMKFIVRISQEIKWKVKVVALEISSMYFILGITKKMKWKSKVVALEISSMNFIRGMSKEIK